MTQARKKFLESVQGKRVRLFGRILRACEKQWLTVAELHKHVNIKSVSLLRNWVEAMHAEGILRMRNRPHEMQENGNKTTGPRPREFKVPSKWGEL